MVCTKISFLMYWINRCTTSNWFQAIHLVLQPSILDFLLLNSHFPQKQYLIKGNWIWICHNQMVKKYYFYTLILNVDIILAHQNANVFSSMVKLVESTFYQVHKQKEGFFQWYSMLKYFLMFISWKTSISWMKIPAGCKSEWLAGDTDSLSML